MTAYRQRSLAIGRFLQEAGPTKASFVAQTLREPKARDILYRDVYGWFERESLGVYGTFPSRKAGDSSLGGGKPRMNRDVSPRLVSPARPFSHSLVQAVFRRALESRPTRSGSPIVQFSD